MSGMGVCKRCGEWIYWHDEETPDGRTRHVPYDEGDYKTIHFATCAAQEWISTGGQTYSVATCRDCKHFVFWTTTFKGKKRPMDCYQDDDGRWVADGECHFDTCLGNVAAATANWQAHRVRQQQATAQVNGYVEEAKDQHQRDVEKWLVPLRLAWPVTAKDVTSAFRKRCLETHPDMGGNANDFIQVKRAYDALRILVTA